MTSSAELASITLVTLAASLLTVCQLHWYGRLSSRHYEAVAMERRIKGWSRAKKMALIRGDFDEISRLAKSKGGPSTSSGRTGQ